MADAQLEAVRETLLAIPASDVAEPTLPMSVALQEANDLAVLLREPAVWERLVSIGVHEAERSALEQAIAAAREAQSLWTVQRDRMKSEAQRTREAAAYAQRDQLLAAGRWNLRGDRVALGALSAIAEGEGLADLVQDLNDLGALFERKREAFAADRTLDVGEVVERARTLASELAAGASSEKLDANQARAVDLRNRAFTRLSALVAPLREAGRYAFREDEGVRRRFTSAYMRQKNRRRGAGEPTSAPEEVSA